MSGKALLLGIDLGGTNCRGALVNPAGEILYSRRMVTRITDGLEIFLDRLTTFVHLLQGAIPPGDSAAVLGIGTPGLIAENGFVVTSPNLSPLDGVDLPERLRERLGLDVVVVNDANAIAWGEASFGAGRGLDSFLTVTLGTGVGGGLVLNRRLWAGADGAAGEVGHMVVDPGGRLCGCGSRGCLEQYASASGIVKTVHELISAGHPSVLAHVPERELTSRLIGESARQGDEVALSALQTAGRTLGQVFAGVANLLNLDGIVVTGGASESLDLMMPALEQEVRLRAFEVPAKRLKIKRGEVGDFAGILGASLLARDRQGYP